MKKVWICNWEIAPGDGLHSKKYQSYDEANAAIRMLIHEKVNIMGCVARLKRKGDFEYVNAIADFLIHYFSDPKFPYCADDIPSENSQDYADCNKYPVDDEFFETDDDFRESGFWINESEFLLKIDGYEISSTFLLEKADIRKEYSDNELRFEYENENGYSNRGGANNVVLYLTTSVDWGTSAYPVMVLKALQDSNKPMTQGDIIDYIDRHYIIKIERKAVSRHLKTLNELGYTIRKSQNGYYIENDERREK